ncbi:MAG: UDP-3-O-(3-hydroxymyristoyl)glucosamine N-acyltransferase [Herminiimonas sp.]|nr:UDP-3-O-(3-hydroxymyristoyl)glucosamine N-acyltransferase [Herminiimonas sp.]
MSTRLAELVERLGGQLRGDDALRIDGIAPLSEAGASHISFLSSAKLRAQAAQSQAAALILAPADDIALGDSYAGARIVTDNPYAYFARAAQWFAARNAAPRVPGIHATASIHPSAQVDASAIVGAHVTVDADAVIGPGATVEAGCFVGRGARIGNGTHLHPNVTFESNCRIGSNGIVHAGAVIGADGFGFANEGGAWIKIPQTGGVLIGDDVEIGANTCIDRGALTDTVIEEGVKLDNQIQIGHNCYIGAHTAMAGCVGVAGSARIGKYCTFGGAAMVLGHLTIADHVHISSASMVSRSIHEAGQYTGFFPLSKNADWEKSAAIVRNLASMREKIRDLEKTLSQLIEKKNE